MIENTWEFERAIGILIDYSLVQIQHNPTLYSLHVCVQDWLTTKPVRPRSYWFAVRGMSDSLVLATCITVDTTMIAGQNYLLGKLECSKFVPHAKRLVTMYSANYHIDDESMEDEFANFLNMSDLLRHQSDFVHTSAVYKHAENLTNRVYGRHNAATVELLYYLGLAYLREGQNSMAEETFLRSINESQNLKNEHLDCSGLMRKSLMLEGKNLLGLAYLQQKRYEKAEELFEDVLYQLKDTDWEDMESRSRFQIAETTGNLGKLYHDRGWQQEAEDQLCQASRYKLFLLGIDHVSTLTTYRDIALLYADQKRWAEGEEYVKKIHTACDGLWLKKDSWLQETMDHLEQVYSARSNPEVDNATPRPLQADGTSVVKQEETTP